MARNNTRAIQIISSREDGARCIEIWIRREVGQPETPEVNHPPANEKRPSSGFFEIYPPAILRQ